MSGLLDGLVGLLDYEFKDTWNSDLKICCSGEEFFVHKVILGAQSEFFYKACDPESPFKEAKTGVIELIDDDPLLIKVMLLYCYGAGFEYIYSDPWFKKNRKETTTDLDLELIYVARVYALADKYRIASLKSCAEERFKEVLEEHWYDDKFTFAADLIREVYRSTPSTDRGLRDLVLHLVSSNMGDILPYKRFKSRMDRIDGFWGDLSQYISDTCERERLCPNEECEEPSKQSFLEWRTSKEQWKNNALCPHCKKSFDKKMWNKPQFPEEEDEADSSDDDDEAPESSKKRKRVEEPPELETTAPEAKSRRLQVCDGI